MGFARFGPPGGGGGYTDNAAPNAVARGLAWSLITNIPVPMEPASSGTPAIVPKCVNLLETATKGHWRECSDKPMTDTYAREPGGTCSPYYETEA